jgi:hypothetical protein
MNQFPPSPRVSHLDCFKFFRKFAEIFASQGAPPVSTTPVANLLPMLLTLVANFASVSLVLLIPVAGVNDTNCHQYQWHRRKICYLCQWRRWQIMETISGCRDPKVNLKAKSTSQRCPKKIIKTFMIEDFFRKFSKKFEMALMAYSWAWGKLIHEKKPKVENLMTLSL